MLPRRPAWAVALSGWYSARRLQPGLELDKADRRRVQKSLGVIASHRRQCLERIRVFHAFRDAKLAEYERYRLAVHPWEHDAYLRVY